MVAYSRKELVHLLLHLVLLIGFTSLSSLKSRKSNGARSNQEVVFLLDVIIIDTSLILSSLNKRKPNGAHSNQEHVHLLHDLVLRIGFKNLSSLMSRTCDGAGSSEELVLLLDIALYVTLRSASEVDLTPHIQPCSSWPRPFPCWQAGYSSEWNRAEPEMCPHVIHGVTDATALWSWGTISHMFNLG